MDASVQTHVQPRETIIHPPPRDVKKAYKRVKMSSFDGVMDGGRARETQG